jgi:electron transfer flavoprotein alpha subunit
MSKFLVIAEVRGGALRQVTLEAVQAAKLAGADSISAVVLGSGITGLATELAGYVDGTVYAVDDVALENYNPELYVSALEGVLQAAGADVIVLGHTALGRDLAPALAAKLALGQLSDVISIADGVYTRPIYAGKAFAAKTLVDDRGIVTVRPNNFTAAVGGKGGSVQDVAYGGTHLRTLVKSVVRNTSGKVDLTEAKVIVSGGRGVKSADGFKVLEELADTLGGAVGASRAACDAEYCDYSLQIGQTGKVVTPDLYIACGISGAIQHLAGMSGSKVIVAINKDPEAPIFQLADYGIVGDLFEVVPLLTAEFKKVLV